MCRCGVAVREFSCDVNLSLTTEDFVRFFRELNEAVRLLKGTAVFTTAEDGLKLEIKFNSGGHADVVGVVRSQLSALPMQTKLVFAFLFSTINFRLFRLHSPLARLAWWSAYVPTFQVIR